jgi:hypothetical protein
MNKKHLYAAIGPSVFLISVILITSCVTPGKTVVYSPLAAKFGKYRSVAVFFDVSGAVNSDTEKQYNQQIYAELVPGLQMLGYNPIYDANNAKKADFWIRLRILELHEWSNRKIAISARFVDLRTKTKIGEILVYGEHSGSPPVMIGFGSPLMVESVYHLAQGPIGNAVENAVKEIITYITNNQ